MYGDPHLRLADGGQADFRGCDGCYFDFLSTDALTVNVRTSDARFQLPTSVVVNGSFVTEVHLLWSEGRRRALRVSHMAEQVGGSNWGWEAVKTTCGRRALWTPPKSTVHCGVASVNVTLSTLTVTLPEWRVHVASRPVYGWIEGPRHRLDMRLTPRVAPHALRMLRPAGVLGQSFARDGPMRNGARDNYTEVATLRTSAMAEGAIDGDWRDYLVQSAFARRRRA